MLTRDYCGVARGSRCIGVELAPARPLEGSEQHQLQMRQQAKLDALRAQIHARILLRPSQSLAMMMLRCIGSYIGTTLKKFGTNI